jgi:hypothetical protein
LPSAITETSILSGAMKKLGNLPGLCISPIALSINHLLRRAVHERNAEVDLVVAERQVHALFLKCDAISLALIWNRNGFMPVYRNFKGIALLQPSLMPTASAPRLSTAWSGAGGGLLGAGDPPQMMEQYFLWAICGWPPIRFCRHSTHAEIERRAVDAPANFLKRCMSASLSPERSAEDGSGF